MIFGNALAFLLKPNTITENRKIKHIKERERERESRTYLAEAYLAPTKAHLGGPVGQPSPPPRTSSSPCLLASCMARAQPSRGHLLLPPPTASLLASSIPWRCHAAPSTLSHSPHAHPLLWLPPPLFPERRRPAPPRPPPPPRFPDRLKSSASSP